MNGQTPRPAPARPLPDRLRAWAIVAWLMAPVGVWALAQFTGADRALLLLACVTMALPALVLTIAAALSARLLGLGDDLQDLRAAAADIDRRLRDQPLPQPPAIQARLEALTEAQDMTQAQMARFISTRGRAPGSAETPPEDQARLALDDATESPTPAPSDLIRALHFPEDEADQPGFDALRKALSDPRIAPLIRAAQDVLTRLAQEGIYMDDLRPDRARPEFWRAFAQGARGAHVAPLGGIRDRSCLALTAARMRTDPEFRASAHLFLREFDRVFAIFAEAADDAQIAAMADTRSARAFMLLGRVSGVFSRAG